MNVLKGKKAVCLTLGCKLNFAETSALAQRLESCGVMMAGSGETADICIVNTCSVTEVADSKCRQAISRLRRMHPGALLVVTGCYAQLQPELVAGLDGVDLVVGAEQKGDIPSLVAERMAMMPEERVLAAHMHMACPTAGIRSFMPSCARGERTRFFLKVQDGCDYYCSYCTIPFARGRSRNGSIASLVAQAEEAARLGGKEIVLTGVNIGDFGRSTGERFIDLLRALDLVEGIRRYRISSIEPNLLTPDVIRFTAESRAFMPHFHIPLQSGSDEVLRLMRRRYDTRFFRQKVEEVRTSLPDAFIGVDVIVGMRGETDEMFARAKRYLMELPVSQYHVFSYSERPGTKALHIPGAVPPAQKHERSKQIMSISDEKLHTHYNICKGQTRPVLLEHGSTRPKATAAESRPTVLHGFTDNYIRVSLRPDAAPEDTKLENTIVPVRLGEWDATGDALTGELAGKPPVQAP